VVDSKANSMMYLPLDKLINSGRQNTQVIFKESQQQFNDTGNTQNLLRSREIR
jgi:membrane protease subunit HflK